MRSFFGGRLWLLFPEAEELLCQYPATREVRPGTERRGRLTERLPGKALLEGCALPFTQEH